jgi:hypothetical protein
LRDFIKELIRYGNKYLDEFLSILSGPKRFLTSLDLNSSESLKKPVIFFIFSLAVVFFLELPYTPKDTELWISYCTLVIFSFIATVATAGLIKLSFFILKGNAEFRTHLIYTFYISGVTTIFIVLAATLSKGFILSKRPDLYPHFKEYMDIYFSTFGRGFNISSLENLEPLFNSGLLSIARLIYDMLMIATMIWIFFCWGSYRLINKISKKKSTLSFIVFLSISVPITYLLIWIQVALKVNLF